MTDIIMSDDRHSNNLLFLCLCKAIFVDSQNPFLVHLLFPSLAFQSTVLFIGSQLRMWGIKIFNVFLIGKKKFSE